MVGDCCILTLGGCELTGTLSINPFGGKIMKKLAIAAALLTTTFLSQAMAADMRAPVYKAPPQIAPAWNWSGFYIGVHGGYGWSRSHWQFDATPGVSTNHSGDGGLAGGQIGWNWQPVGSNWVFGLEADGSWADIKGSTFCPNAAFSCQHKVGALATFRGRIGYSFGPVMIYGTGGGAYGDVKFRTVNIANGAQFGSTFSDANWGWSAGGGLEWAFAGPWSAKFEYMHYDFGRDTAAAGVLGAGTARVGLTIDTVKAGVNYRFSM
jgi:outer membrane immunogenic protein